MLDLIAIDVGAARVRLCRWDGREARALEVELAKPDAGWRHWLSELGITGAHEVVFRCTHPEWSAEFDRDRVGEFARAAGGRWLRFLTSSATSNPGLAAARYLADRTRWTSLVSVEQDGADVHVGLQDRRGRMGGFMTLRAGDLATDSAVSKAAREMMQASVVKNVNASEGVMRPAAGDRRGLVCLGDAAERWGPVIAETLSCTHALVPTNAESWPLLGMLIAPIELEFEQDMAGREMTVSELRGEFVGLMDIAGDAITREGYDLDDAESTRHVVLEGPREEGGAEVDLESLIAAGREREADRKHPVRSIRVRSVVYPPRPDWPVDVAPLIER